MSFMSEKAVQDRVYRFLKFKSSARTVGCISGRTICLRLRLQFSTLHGLNDARGIGSFGPANSKQRNTWQARGRYAKDNAYYAGIRAFFIHKGRTHCHKDRPLRKGKLPPGALMKFRHLGESA